MADEGPDAKLLACGGGGCLPGSWVLLLLPLLWLPGAAWAGTCNLTSDGDYASASSFSGASDCPGTLSPDDSVSCGGDPLHPMTVHVTGPIDFTTGSFDAEAGCNVVFDVPAQDRPLRMTAGPGGMTFADGSSLVVRGGWIAPNPSGAPALLASAPPSTPFAAGEHVELAPGGDRTRVRFWYSPATGAGAAQHDATVLHMLADIQKRRAQGLVMLELYDPDPSVEVGGDSLSRYAVLLAVCDATRYAGCSGAPGDHDGDGIGELGYLDVSMRQFARDYVGLEAKFQDLVRQRIAADVEPGDRCLRVDPATLQPSLPGAHDQRDKENLYAGWWISLESNGVVEPTAANAYAIARTLDSSSALNDTGLDVICLADSRGVREAHAAADASANEFVIHRGILPGDPFRVYVPVEFTRSAATSPRTVYFLDNGAVDVRGAHWHDLFALLFGNGSANDGPDGGVATVEESSFFGCETAAGSCLQFEYPPGDGGRVVLHGFAGAGGGDCADASPPYCEPEGDGDVHYLLIRQATSIDLERVSIRWVRDDSIFTPTGVDPNDLDITETWRQVVSQDSVMSVFGPDTGNFLDCTVDYAHGSTCHLDIRWAACLGCTIDDGSPVMVLITGDDDADGLIDELGVVGAYGGAVDNGASYPDRKQPLYRSYINIGSMIAPNTKASGGGVLVPRNAEGFAVHEYAAGGAANTWSYDVLPWGAQGAAIHDGYLRDIWQVPLVQHAIPSTGTLSDVAVVNLSGATDLYAPMDVGSPGSPIAASNLTLAETSDFRSGRWGSGPGGLFLGTPTASADLGDMVAIATNARTPDLQIGGLLLQGWSADNLGADHGIGYTGAPNLPSWSGNACFYGVAPEDLSADAQSGIVSAGHQVVDAGKPDYFDVSAADFYAPHYRGAHACGVTQPVGVCKPTYLTRRLHLDWRQFCMGGRADTDGDCVSDVDEIAAGTDPLVPNGPPLCAPEPSQALAEAALLAALAWLQRRRERSSRRPRPLRGIDRPATRCP